MEPDRVTYAFGMTLNTGNYESARFDVSMSTDVASDETREDAIIRVSEFVESVVFAKVEEIKGAK